MNSAWSSIGSGVLAEWRVPTGQKTLKMFVKNGEVSNCGRCFLRDKPIHSWPDQMVIATISLIPKMV